VRPEEAGIGATPACMAKQASERNRMTLAVSPTIFAVVRPPAPCRSISRGAAARARVVISRSRALTRTVAARMSVSNSAASRARTWLICSVQVCSDSQVVSRSSRLSRFQSAGGYIEFGVELVQVPAQPVGHLGAFDDQVVAVIGQQLQRARGVVVAGHRKVGLAQGSAGDGEGVDRVGLARVKSRRSALTTGDRHYQFWPTHGAGGSSVHETTDRVENRSN